MLKSVEMEIKRDDFASMYNYYDAIDRIEKNNNSPKDMVSDGFKIRLLKKTFDSSNDNYVELNNKVAELKTRYDRNLIDIVTIISIFIAITIGMVSGISYSLEAFTTFTNGNYLKVSLLTLIVGFVIVNLFYALFKFVGKLTGKDFDSKGYIIYINVVFVLLIIFFLLISTK